MIHCPKCGKDKTRVVIEIKGGALFSAFCDDDIELILIDWDEIDGDKGASAVVIPEKLGHMELEVVYLAEDAVRRAR